MAKVNSPGSELDSRPLFAVQRYGEGKTAIFATGDTWQWQMRRDHEDMRHERLWRQIIRNLVYENTGNPACCAERKTPIPKACPSISSSSSEIICTKHQEGLQSVLALTTPSQEEITLSVDESIQEAGLYTGRFTPEQSGLHRISFTAVNEKDEIAATVDEAFSRRAGSPRVFFARNMTAAFCADVSEATGGKVYSLDNLDALAPRGARARTDGRRRGAASSLAPSRVLYRSGSHARGRMVPAPETGVRMRQAPALIRGLLCIALALAGVCMTTGADARRNAHHSQRQRRRG